MDWQGGAGLGRSASACSLFGGDGWHLSEQLQQGHPWEWGLDPAQAPPAPHGAQEVFPSPSLSPLPAGVTLLSETSG